MINSLSSRLGPPEWDWGKLPSMTLRRLAEQYHVVVTQRGVQSWEWEIYRDGAPLPIPLRGGYYKAKNTKNRCAGFDPSHYLRRRSLRLDAQFPDERPPFLGIGFLHCAESLRRLSFAWENLPSEIDEPRSHRLIGQCLHCRRIELVDNIHWRALGREKCIPSRKVKHRQSHLAKNRDVGGQCQARLACHRIGLYAPGPHQRQLIWCAEYQVDFTSHQVLEFRGGATIWHEGKLRLSDGCD
jgi:hypothetical protein